jgi:hypothetical protein
MTKSSKCSLVCCMVLLCICISPAWSRPWKPAPHELASDYATINHNRGPDKNGNSEVVMLLWLVPQRFPENNPLRLTFEKYVVIGVVHAHMSASTGVATFDRSDALQPRDGSGNLLKQLSGSSVPPVLAGAMTAMEGIFRQSLGAFGQGMTWFIFEAGAIQTCDKGMLIVPYAGEDYTYELPLPGCPK